MASGSSRVSDNIQQNQLDTRQNEEQRMKEILKSQRDIKQGLIRIFLVGVVGK